MCLISQSENHPSLVDDSDLRQMTVVAEVTSGSLLSAVSVI